MRYSFEWNDLRALVTVINVILIMRFGLSIAWFSLGVATMGLIKDITIDKKVNGMIMHAANILLNLYFIFWMEV
jgi:hypothetical protein